MGQGASLVLRVRHCLLGLCLMQLAACGGDGGGSRGDSPDPVVVDMPLAYVKRVLPRDDDGELQSDNLLEPAAFHAGAALFIRDRAAPSAQERNISDRAWPAGALYDVKDLEVSADGDKLLFAMRGPEDPDLDDDEQPKWDIWEYEVSTDTLRRIIAAETIAQQNHDVAPHYLADGRIVFSSDRQQGTRSILLNDGKPQYAGMHEGNLANGDEAAFVLHVMDDDGTDLEQITFNQSHDLQPAVLANGRLIFLRWDRWSNNNLSLYTSKPDGSDLQLYYGFHSQNTGTGDTPAVFSQPRQMPDGRIISILRPRESSVFGGDMLLIDGANYVDDQQAVHDGPDGSGQQSASLLEVKINEEVSPHGYFSTAYPLFDGSGRLLVGWNQCRLRNPQEPETILPCSDSNLQIEDIEEAEPAYGLWVYDPQEGTQLPVIPGRADTIIFDLVALEPRARPSHIAPLDSNEAVGTVHIRSVYDFNGVDTAADGIEAMRDPAQTAWSERPARFLQIIKAVSMPPEDLLDFNNGAFGINGAGQAMREIIGYVPIEPDGSVKFQVPADVAFSFSVLDAEARRLNGFGRHQNWLYVRPGEVLECKGCHQRGNTLPHGRFEAQAPSINQGAPTTAPFPNTRVPAEIGETMAEAFARTEGTRRPSTDIVFDDDDWVQNADDSDDLFYSYSELEALGLPTPVGGGCEPWTAACRVTINYLDHIQPLWDLPREIDGVEQACSSCHSKTAADGSAQVPPGQLELTAGPADGVLNAHQNANALWNLSYRELFLGDAELELEGGNLRQRTIVVQEEVRDPETDEIITPELIRVLRCNPPMSSAGARASSQPRVSNNVDCEENSSPRDFFSWFTPGAAHAGYLSDSELKLISEWLDIGAQYFNNPFDAPAE